MGNVASEFKVTWPDGSTTPFGLNEERERQRRRSLYGAELVLRRGRAAAGNSSSFATKIARGSRFGPGRPTGGS